MLERPALADERIRACLRKAFGLPVTRLAFLPWGADAGTAVFRAEADDGAVMFVKLRRGPFAPAAVRVPHALAAMGFDAVIAPLATGDGRLWAGLDAWKVIVYPFVEGHNGYDAPLTAPQWTHLGAQVRRFHEARFPAHVTAGVPREVFTSRWRDALRRHLTGMQDRTFPDPLAARAAAFLTGRRAALLERLDQTGRLADALRRDPPEFILCHADLHLWNVLVDACGGLYIVDWDTLIFAPKERDLMFPGAGLGDSGRPPSEEEALFFQGYGPAPVRRDALAYYRLERVIEDLAIFCEQIFQFSVGEDDRRQALEYLRSNFAPGGTIERALAVLDG